MTVRRRKPISRQSLRALERERALQPVRDALRERSRGYCEARFSPSCTGVGVHAHHMLTRARGGDDVLENLLWVCAFCHDHIHANPARAFDAGWLRHRLPVAQ